MTSCRETGKITTYTYNPDGSYTEKTEPIGEEADSVLSAETVTDDAAGAKVCEEIPADDVAEEDGEQKEETEVLASETPPAAESKVETPPVEEKKPDTPPVVENKAETPKHVHVYTHVVVPASDTDDGFEADVCTCGAKINLKVLPRH